MKSKLNSVKRFEFSIKFGVEWCIECSYFGEIVGKKFGQFGQNWVKMGFSSENSFQTKEKRVTIKVNEFFYTRINLQQSLGARFFI